MSVAAGKAPAAYKAPRMQIDGEWTLSSTPMAGTVFALDWPASG